MPSILKERDIRKSFTQRMVFATKLWKKMHKPALEKRNRIIQAWSAGYYGDGIESGKPRPINLTDRGIGIIAPYLVMSNPKLMVKTRYTEFRPFAYTSELAANYHNAETKLGQRCLRPAVVNSLIGMGVVKTGIMHEYDTFIRGQKFEIGEIYSDVVDDSDYVGDPSAYHRDAFEFEGNLYQLPTEYARDFFGPKHADRITPIFKLWGEVTPDEITKGDVHRESFRLKEFSEFLDIYLPDENVIVTINPHEENPRILRTVEWEGPDGGPYDVLGYKYPPKQSIPIPPVWGWLDLEDAINVLVNKLRSQAEEEKSILAYQSGSEQDADRIAKAKDRGTARVDNIEGVKIFEFPGVNAEYYNWLGYLETHYNKAGGNLETMGGVGPQAETLGQEQMLLANATRGIDDMRTKVYEFAQSIMQKRLWYLWTDPLIQIPVVKRIGAGINIQASFDRTAREGEFWKYSFDIVPYSMQRMGPDIEYRRVLTYLSQIALPLASLAAQQGVTLNVDSITSMMARYMGIEDVDQIWERAVPVNDASQIPWNPQVGSVKSKGQNPHAGFQDGSSREMNAIQNGMRTGDSV